MKKTKFLLVMSLSTLTLITPVIKMVKSTIYAEEASTSVDVEQTDVQSVQDSKQLGRVTFQRPDAFFTQVELDLANNSLTVFYEGGKHSELGSIGNEPASIKVLEVDGTSKEIEVSSYFQVEALGRAHNSLDGQKFYVYYDEEDNLKLAAYNKEAEALEPDLRDHYIEYDLIGDNPSLETPDQADIPEAQSANHEDTESRGDILLPKPVQPGETGVGVDAQPFELLGQTYNENWQTILFEELAAELPEAIQSEEEWRQLRPELDVSISPFIHAFYDHLYQLDFQDQFGWQANKIYGHTYLLEDYYALTPEDRTALNQLRVIIYYGTLLAERQEGQGRKGDQTVLEDWQEIFKQGMNLVQSSEESFYAIQSIELAEGISKFSHLFEAGEIEAYPNYYIFFVRDLSIPFVTEYPCYAVDKETGAVGYVPLGNQEAIEPIGESFSLADYYNVWVGDEEATNQDELTGVNETSADIQELAPQTGQMVFDDLTQGVNAPNQIILNFDEGRVDLVNTIMNSQMSFEFSGFEDFGDQAIEFFPIDGAPLETMTVTLNQGFRLGNNLGDASGDRYLDDEFLLYANDQGEISLIAYNYAGNVPGGMENVRTEYVLVN
ncbi:hypothetical protein [Hutsoniella sourekii]|uniref:hypothetical protein n=1 Tax=Hutsoniella sourekii TaxID=87650 RepID=UPI00048031BF|nr:hypothetical protein [Hutsoniella sourekii]